MRLRHHSLPGRQRGVVLLIALIVLVAMSLAGVALIRSVDTTVVAAGNLAFSQSALQSGDVGLHEAAKWLETKNGGPDLAITNEGNGYFSAPPFPEPDWYDMDSWAGSSMLVNGGTPDASGNVVRYVIHRLCQTPGKGWIDNNCARAPGAAGSTGMSQTTTAPPYEGTPKLFYRITSRVDGPRNTVSVSQGTVILPVPGG
jgi:type IV pilus assembly protein PilX